MDNQTTIIIKNYNNKNYTILMPEDTIIDIWSEVEQDKDTYTEKMTHINIDINNNKEGIQKIIETTN